MSVNPASNYPNLAGLSISVLQYGAIGGHVDNLIQAFLTDLSGSTYTPMATALNEALATYGINANASLRILLAIDDGTVAYDSATSTANTYTNYANNAINSSNHNTRPEIMVAILGNSGVGLSNRYSRSVQKFLKYQATRLGGATQSNLGTFRVSLTDAL